MKNVNNITLKKLKAQILFYIAVSTLFLSINSVKAQGSLSVSPKPGKHTDAVPTSVIPTLSSPAGLHLKLESTSIANANDEIGVYFSNAWSDDYDSNDSYDLDGLDPQVYLSSFTADGVRVAINAMSSYTIPKRIKLYVRSVANGSYFINLEDFTNIDTSLYNINLVDNQQKDSVNLVKFSTYTFSMIANDTAAYSNRFVLSIEAKTLPQYQLANFAGQKVTEGVQVNWKTVNAGNYTGFTLQKLTATNGYDSLYSVQSDSATSYSYVDPHPIIGNNVYRLAQNGITGTITYSAPITIGYGTVTPTTALNVYPNPSKSVINISLTTSGTTTPVYTADIYNMSGSLVNHQTVSSATFTQDISSYKYGVYFIQLKDPNGYLVGQTKFVKSN
jgi:hypothetical protein